MTPAAPSRSLTFDDLEGVSRSRADALLVGEPAPVSVVLVTHNASRFVRPALASVFAQTNVPIHVVVVDNASSDDTISIVRSCFPQVSLTALPRNVGFGRACNIGIQEAINRRAEFVLLLNQDAVLHGRALAALVHRAGEAPGYALLGACQFTYDGNALDGVFKEFVPAELLADFAKGQMRPVYKVGFVPAVAVLLRAEALCAVGGFDPLFFMYHEDQDLCRRLTAAGWQVGVVPSATVKHWNSNTHARRTWQWEQNWAYSDGVLHLKWSPRSFPVAWATLFAVWAKYDSTGPRRWSARFVAWSRCLLRARRIRRHRMSVPFTFAPGGD